MENRRGQALSTNTLILIILGVVILVVLILGFTIGWNRFLPFISSNNIDNIATSCTAACATQNTFSFCETPREVNDGINDKFTATCAELSGEDYIERNYGIESCSTINCN